jgi:TRAP-type C4-dicarboxylate transport system substrate-binding protein
MSESITRRTAIAATAAVAMQPWSAAQAKYPFCHALQLVYLALPEMRFWVDVFQSEVRKRITWEDGLTVTSESSAPLILNSASRLAEGSLEMGLIHSSLVSLLVPDFAVLNDPRLGAAVARSDDGLQNLVRRMAELAEKSNLTLLGLAWNFDFLGLRRDKAVNRLDDLKGLKIGARGDQTQAFVSALAATAVQTNAMNDALRTGQIDGAVLSARSLERQKLDDLSLVSFGTSFQLLQGYVMLINRPLFQGVEGRAQQAFSDAGRAAARVYQQNENEMKAKVLAGDFRPFTKISSIGSAEVSGFKPELIKALDKRYAERKISDETLALVRSLAEIEQR